MDVLVNNASEIGPAPMPALAQYPWEARLTVTRVNAVAPLHLTQMLLPQMIRPVEEVVINGTSDTGKRLDLPGGGTLPALTPHPRSSRRRIARLDLPLPLVEGLEDLGMPDRLSIRAR